LGVQSAESNVSLIGIPASRVYRRSGNRGQFIGLGE
jgi:hypothetical protein